MKVYVFGNRDYEPDSPALLVMDTLKPVMPEIDWCEVKPNEDVMFDGQENAVMMDVVAGIPHMTVLTENDLGMIADSARGTVHDFDLGFQLQYLIKLGKLKRFWLVGLPMGQVPDYDSIQLTFKKLVAQDIQGS